MSDIFFIFYAFAGLLFSLKRGLRYLQYLQQDEYNNRRFLRWYWLNKAYDTKGAKVLLAGILAALLLSSVPYAKNLILLAVTAAILSFAVRERDPRTAGKVKLNFTERARRIFLAYLVLFLIFNFSCQFLLSVTTDLTKIFISQLLFFQILPLILLLANSILLPLQKKVNQHYIDEAQTILKAVNPYTIGITGSYGKTSAKHALGEILSSTLAPTFFTPKSINTILGITREIREQLKPFHKYAIIEMGAYREDSIKKLCQFTPPSAGIITAIGLSHLERFKSEEAVYRAKSELAKAIPQSGVLVCNGDNPGARRIATEFKKDTTLLYGFENTNNDLDCHCKDLSCDHTGSSFTIVWKGVEYPAKSKLLGQPNIANLLGAFTLACALGAQPKLVIGAIFNLEPVDNRLKLAKSNGITYLQDAFNSNPTGFAAALDVLEQLKGGQKILMTPGMVELGDREFVENELIGEKAAKICDHVVIVAETNREALLSGVIKGGMAGSSITTVDTREEAFEYISTIQQEGDIVLIENDLPDLYEGQEKF